MDSDETSPRAQQNCVRIILLGNSQAGKTSLILRYTDSNFSSTIASTIGVDFRIKIIKVKGKDVRLEIWDTGGQERYRTIAKSYYDRAMGVVLVYDCTDERSFGDIHNWMKQIEYHARPDIVSILVSSKCDLQDRRIDTESGKALAEELGIEFVETSAKMNVNVDKVFQLITEQIIEKDVSANPKNIKSVTVKKDTTNRSKKDKCC
eukprot:TRINITY_DN9753_c0_g1_i1.p1 TRINITY_DN9753_c0_g1~~TRINITY_DN9753_c0_g1_i1.p1  ORF type:complete len:206 (+),score=73.16 TRINITY_DN9753_c0_g1_i1:146-763(+)